MKENIRLGLLGVIAVVLVYHTFFNEDHQGPIVPNTGPELQSNIALNPTNQQQPGPNNVSSGPMPMTNMQFTEKEWNFGKILQDTKNMHIFRFTNSGSNPLVISSARGSCGCTVPEYPKKPIAPGGSGEIKVTYSPGKQEGTQHKTVTITANTQPPTTVLNIRALVDKSQ